MNCDDESGTWPLAYIPYGGAEFGEMSAVAKAIVVATTRPSMRPGERLQRSSRSGQGSAPVTAADGLCGGLCTALPGKGKGHCHIVGRAFGDKVDGNAGP